MKRVDVTSWSQSQGWPIVRVRMSHETDRENPNSINPQMIIKTISSLSRARHFKWRCRFSTSLSAIATSQHHGWGLPPASSTSAFPDPGRSVDGPYQSLDLVGVGAELLGELVQVGFADLLKAGFVDVGDDLDA